MKYVSEEELRKWLITDGCEEGHGYIDEDDFVCMDWQDNPIKTGHWIKYSIPICEEQHYKCTSCGYYINFGGELCTKEFKYCPNCGARMIESEE